MANGDCEIGVHLHAWNNPPYYQLDGPYSGNPYLIEYPQDVMRDKFKTVYDLIVANFGVKPVSHRAGRWAMDDRYFKILNEFGIKVDCSYTPGINWDHIKGITTGGSDYSKKSTSVTMINGVMEVPATIRYFRNCLNGSWKHRVKSIIKGEQVWLRPAMSSLAGMKKVLDIVEKEPDVDFVEFMLHSSEVMPGGSPYFRTEAEIEKEYKTIEAFFEYARSKGYVGSTLAEYYYRRNENTASHL